MNPKHLITYFEDETEQQKALESVRQEGWLEPRSNAILYNASRRAFDPTARRDDADRHFKKIYDELKGRWQVFRSPNPEPPWPPERIFEAIRSEFSEFSWGGAFNLPNVPVEDRIKSRLEAMRGIKPNKGYPSMAVSKFLHFYNPNLFPIYDYEYIWVKVCNGRFKGDYREFGDLERRKWNYGEDDETFLPFYMRWASSLIRGAHPAFMQVFGKWFDEQLGSKTFERTFDSSTLYATAFEYTAIGAAQLP